MRKFWKAFDFFEESVMVAGMAVMVLFNFLNVVCRYLLPQTPFSYTEELVVLLFIWISLFGISYGFRTGSHTVLTILSDRLPAPLRSVIVFLATAACALLMLTVARTGYGMVMNQIRYGQILPGMRIPMAVAGLAVPVGSAISFVSVLRAGFIELKGMRHIKDSGETGRESA